MGCFEMGKANIRPLVRGYLDTLRNYLTGKVSWGDVTFQLVIPAMASFALFILWPVYTADVSGLISNIISCVSIVSGLMCGVAVLLFQLRLQMTIQDDPKPTDRELKLVDESFKASMWAVLIGLASVGILIVAPLVRLNQMRHLLYSLGLFCLMNFMMTTFMVLKKTASAYELFSRGWQR